MCIYKTSIVIRTSGNLAAILDSEHTSTSHETGSTTIRKFDTENIGVAVRILSLYALELEICMRAILPLPNCRQTSQKPLPGEGLIDALRFRNTAIISCSGVGAALV